MHTFFTPGVPAPQGSKRYVGNGVMVESSKALAPWRKTVVNNARRSWTTDPLDGPVALDLEFVMRRPKAWGKNRHDPMTQRPDIDKLSRAILDAITGVLVLDDSQVTTLTAHKRRAHPGEPTGVHITLRKGQP